MTPLPRLVEINQCTNEALGASEIPVLTAPCPFTTRRFALSILHENVYCIYVCVCVCVCVFVCFGYEAACDGTAA